MKLQITLVNSDIAVVRIIGNFCGGFARKVSELLALCLDNGVKSFVLDMLSCTSIDSIGVRLLKMLSLYNLKIVNMGWSAGEWCLAEGFDHSKVNGCATVENVLNLFDVKSKNRDRYADLPF
jgi:hypothetical protein